MTSPEGHPALFRISLDSIPDCLIQNGGSSPFVVHTIRPISGSERMARSKNRRTRTGPCPLCGDTARRHVYDIGSGPELSCASCEWCWGADGQPLKPIIYADVVRRLGYDPMRNK